MIRMMGIMCISLIISMIGCNKDNGPTGPEIDFTELTGPYLGQTLPGTTPVVFAPEYISNEDREAFLVSMPGGNELYYGTIWKEGNDAKTRIHTTKIVDGHWTNPVEASFNSDYLDGYFGIHPNGSRFYYQSGRPVDASESVFEYNIWYMDRIGNGWSEPQSMGRPINGQNHTSGPSVTMDGTMYYTVMAIGGLQEIYRSKLVNGVYQAAERLPDQVNSTRQQFDSYIAPDESYLLFNAELEDTRGGIDLYVSFRDENDNWSDPINLGPTINTEDDDGSATITPDGRFIFFWLMNGDNELDIFWVDAAVIDNFRPAGF